jgi:hypothetical protein
MSDEELETLRVKAARTMVQRDYWRMTAHDERERAEVAEAAIARVRAVHPQGDPIEGIDSCRACLVEWPCPTIAALEAP